MESLITMENGVAVLDAKVASFIAFYEWMIKGAEFREKRLREAILDAMEQTGTIKIETDDLVISYIASADREEFDKRRFRTENPELYDNYVDIKSTKPSIRIKLKE